MDAPLISVALATYNGEKYIKDQINSILNQTYKNIEIIICDDNSIDKTYSILTSFQKIHFIKIFRNKSNLGYIKNFEKVLSLCSGDYIAFCDQDDIWLPNKLELLFKNIGNFSLILSDSVIIDSNGKIISSSYFKMRNENFESNLSFKLLLGNSFQGCMMLFKKDVLTYALPFPKSYPPHDWWISLISCKLNGIKIFPTSLMKWRRHSQTDTTSESLDFKSNNSRLLKFLLFFKYYQDILKLLDGIRNSKKKYQNVYEDFIHLDIFTIKEITIMEELLKMHNLLDRKKSKLQGFKILYRYRSFLFPENRFLFKWGRLFLVCFV